MYFVYDTETSGLPARGGPHRGYHHPKDIAKYDTARIVSIAWIVLDKDLNEISKGDRLISPKDFVIGADATKIHGITQKHASENGADILDVLAELVDIIAPCRVLVAHNVWFDVNVLRSECFRYKQIELAALLDRSIKYCTMTHGKLILGLPRNPTLNVLYTTIFGEGVENAHDARYDTYHCCKCFIDLKKRPIAEVAVPKKRKAEAVLYTDEQQDVIQADPNVNLLVVACAGAGKTRCIIARIVHLAKYGVKEDEIILTTFTRDAAKEMEARLVEALGRPTNVKVGTFDALALRFLKDHHQDTSTLSVADYAPHLLAFLRTPSGKTFCQGVKHMFIDEFQDINEVQYNVIKEMFLNDVIITCVGDEAQNIYAFRGSDSRYINQFETLFPGAKVSRLTTNFRSSPEIVAVANSVMKRNARANAEPASKPAVHYFPTAALEHDFIADIVSNNTRSKKIRLHEMVVVSPQNAFLFQLEEFLTRRGIAHYVFDGSKASLANQQDRLCLTTIHKAKGLEWDTVFMIGMNDRVFPSADIEEGRRLFYVGVTRPSRELYMTFSPCNGTALVSRYVREVNANLLSFHNMPMLASVVSEAEHKSRQTHPMTLEKYVMLNYASISSPKLRHVTHMDSIVCPDFVQETNVQDDFHTFVKIAFTRIMAGVLGIASGYNYKPAAVAICSMKSDYDEHRIYTKYRSNFEQSLATTVPLLHNAYANAAEIIKLFAAPKVIDGADVGLVLGLIRKMFKRATACNVPLQNITIVPFEVLPNSCIPTMCAALSRFENASLTSQDVAMDMWHLSKCEAVIRKRRRRSLYLDIDAAQLDAGIFEGLKRQVEALLALPDMSDENADTLQMRRELSDTSVIRGETMDVVGRNVLLTIDCTHNFQQPDAQRLLEGQAYALHSHTPQTPHTLIVINPLHGTISSYELHPSTCSIVDNDVQ